MSGTRRWYLCDIGLFFALVGTGCGGLRARMAEARRAAADLRSRPPSPGQFISGGRVLPSPGEFISDERVLRLLAATEVAKEQASSFLRDEKPEVQWLGLRLAAALREPSLYADARRLFVPRLPFDSYYTIKRQAIRRAVRAMELAAQLDRMACLKELICMQDYLRYGQSDPGPGDEGKWRRNISASAFRLLRGVHHRTPVLLPKPGSSTGITVKEALLPGFRSVTVGACAKALLEEGKISKATARYVWIENCHDEAFELVRNWFLLFLASPEVPITREVRTNFVYVLNYIKSRREVRARPWLILALQDKRFARHEDEPEDPVVPSLKLRLLQALWAVCGSRSSLGEDPAAWLKWYVGRDGGQERLAKTEADMKELRRTWVEKGIRYSFDSQIYFFPAPPEESGDAN